MFIGKKLEVQLFGGTIERGKFPWAPPFYEDSTVNRMKIYFTKLRRFNSK